MEKSVAPNTITFCDVPKLERRRSMPLQSATDEPLASSETKNQVMTFLDQNKGDHTDFKLSDMPIDAYKSDSTLGEYLSRPVRIANYTWAENSNIDQTFDPWTLFLQHASIKRKIDNYNFANFDLKIKVMINASPFYYGCAGLFYRPLVDLNPSLIVEQGTTEGFLVPLSQRPHIWLYPANSQGGEMTLPFFYHKNWLNIKDANDTDNMGKLRLISYTALFNANSVTLTDCDIQIYAWAENVKMCGPTVGLSLQSAEAEVVAKETAKEYDNNGVVSSVASSISRTTGDLANKTTGALRTGLNIFSSGADFVGRVASVFGFTNTPNIEAACPYKSVPFHAIATSEISKPIDRLTLDPKNIITKDSSLSGVQLGDELNIAQFCARESFLDRFTWVAIDTPDQLLWGSAVRPQLLRQETTVTSYPLLQMTPMSLMNDLFQYWRGSIVFRFRFICSKYHRGRVRITWDPSENLSLTADSQTTNYNRIVDIAEEPDVVLEVPFLQGTSYLRTVTGFSEVFGTNPSAPVVGTDNGQISIRVLTQQTSPVASADITCIVSVYGKDMQFGAPDQVPDNISYYPLQSSSEDLMYREGVEPTPMFERTIDSPDLNLVYMGENITSLEQLMRRFTYMGSAVFPSNTTARFADNAHTINRYPKLYGYDPEGYADAAGTIVPGTDFPFNYAHNSCFNLISTCFVGSRGSVNWLFNCDSDLALGSFTAARDSNALDARDDYTQQFLTSAGATDFQCYQAFRTVVPTGQTGMSLTSQYTQAGLEVNVPFYSRFRFRGNGITDRSNGSLEDDSRYDNLRVDLNMHPSSLNNPDAIHLDRFFGIGPDFSLLFFLNVPTLHQLNTVPAAPAAV